MLTMDLTDLALAAYITLNTAVASFLVWGRLSRLEHRIDAQGKELRSEFRDDVLSLRSEFREDVLSLRSEFRELRSEFRELRSEIREDLQALRSDLTQVALAVGAQRPRAVEE